MLVDLGGHGSEICRGAAKAGRPAFSRPALATACVRCVAERRLPTRIKRRSATPNRFVPAGPRVKTHGYLPVSLRENACLLCLHPF